MPMSGYLASSSEHNTYASPSPINYDRVTSADDIKPTTMPRAPTLSSIFEAHSLTMGGVPLASNVAHSTAGVALTNIESGGVEEGQLVSGHPGTPWFHWTNESRHLGYSI